MADLELRIHRKLLERLDLYEFESQSHYRHPRHLDVGEQHRGRVPRDEVFAEQNEPCSRKSPG